MESEIYMDYLTQDYSDLEARYKSAETYIENMSKGIITSLIINGPPGLGKTYSVEQYLKKYTTNKHSVYAGHMSMLSLYGTLYKHRKSGEIVVLDDIDSVLKDIAGVNLLKAAMDTKNTRNISWESTSKMLDVLNIPTSFKFEGSVILISNIRARNAGDKALNSHLNALKDRSYSISIADSTKESQFKQVCYMVVKRGLLSRFNLDQSQELEILKYIENNLNRLDRISLRTAVKLAQLIEIDANNWHHLADNGILDEGE